MRLFRGRPWWFKGVFLVSTPLFFIFTLWLIPAGFSSKLNKLNQDIYHLLGDPIASMCWFQGMSLKFSEDLQYSYNSSCFVNKAQLDHKLSNGLPAWAHDQIQSDLSKFEVIHRSDLDHYATAYNPPNVLARFRVEKGKVKIILPVVPPNSSTIVRKEKEAFYALYTGFQQHHRFKVLYNMLKFMAKHGYIPDTDFIVGVWDKVSIPSVHPSPIFAFAKALDDPSESDAILMPDWLNLSSVTHLRPLIRKANQKYNWQDKKNLIFWRGGGFDSTGFRHKMVDLSKRHPDLMDARFVTQDSKEPFVRPVDHLQYRYLLSIDGVRCSWERLIWQLHSNSLVFKHDSDQVQWFYKGIKPYVHYLPIRDESDLFEKQRWAESHPKEVQNMITQANAFVEQNLSLEDMYHYVIVLLREYNKKLKP